MSFSLQKSDSEWVLRLEGEVDISCAAEFKRALMEAVASGKRTRIDAGGVEEVDVTAIQLLWAAARECEKSGKELVMEPAMSPVLQQAAMQTGFERSTIFRNGRPQTPKPTPLGGC